MWKVSVQSGSRGFRIHGLTFIDWASLWWSWKMSVVRWSLLWCAVRVDMITNGRNYEGDACKCPFVILICFYGVSYSVLSLSIRLHQAHVQASIKRRSETHFKLRVTRRCCFIFTFITPRMCAERVGVSLAWKWQPVSCAIFSLVVTCRRVEGKDRI